MKCVVGIDLGSTTTKAVLLDEDGAIIGRGITNSRSNYNVASMVARTEGLIAARFTMLRRGLAELGLASTQTEIVAESLSQHFRLELYLVELEVLREEILRLLASPAHVAHKAILEPVVMAIMDDCRDGAPKLFGLEAKRRSDFFRDMAGTAFMASAEVRAKNGEVPFERVVAVFDRAIFNVEANLVDHDFGSLLSRGYKRTVTTLDFLGPIEQKKLDTLVTRTVDSPLHEVAFVGTGYGRQTLPFPKEAVRSEILCHGRGAHRVFPETRTVLDIGGQDTKAIQVDEHGVVTSFQMNDRCAAGCGRYLGYIADELGLGLHELGPLALEAKKKIKVNSTCTVFAGAELRERLSLGQQRSDILAGLHRSIILRAMSLLARSGGVRDEFTFTGGVCKNDMATQILRELVVEHYGADIKLNAHPDSIYMGSLGAALFGLDDLRRGAPQLLPAYEAENRPQA